MRTFGDFNRAWITKRAGTELFRGLDKAVNHGGISHGEVGALFFVSVTGMSSPQSTG